MIRICAEQLWSCRAATIHSLACAIVLGCALSAAGCGGGENKAGGTDSLAAKPGTLPVDHHHDDPALAGAGHTHSTRLEFSAQPEAIPAGAPATLSLRIVDMASGAPVKDFAEVHEKLLHLIVVSEDLAWFNHLHPEYKGDGLFTITTTLPNAGRYKLYADYTPKGKDNEVATHVFATTGAPASLVAFGQSADTAMTKGFLVKRIKSAPEGEPHAQGSDTYEVGLMPMPRNPVAGEDVMLHFQIRNDAGQPMTDVEPYLGAMGHAVILSSDAAIYLHTHPMTGDMDHSAHGGSAGAAAAPATDAKPAEMKPGGPDVVFHTNFPKPGLYKVWGQFQHKGRIITAPFVVSVAPAA